MSSIVVVAAAAFFSYSLYENTDSVASFSFSSKYVTLFLCFPKNLTHCQLNGTEVRRCNCDWTIERNQNNKSNQYLFFFANDIFTTLHTCTHTHSSFLNILWKSENDFLSWQSGCDFVTHTQRPMETTLQSKQQLTRKMSSNTVAKFFSLLLKLQAHLFNSSNTRKVFALFIVVVVVCVSFARFCLLRFFKHSQTQ